MNLIEGIEVTPKRVEVRLNARFRRRYLWDDFFVEYDDDIGLDRMPLTVALAPFILNVVQLVWFSDDRYQFDALDEDLAQSLEAIRPAFQALYPRRRWAGELWVGNTVRNVANARSADGKEIDLLFTGGVDSVFTSLYNYPRRQNLITVWGNETALDFEEKWLAFRNQVRDFAGRFGHRNTFLKTNAKEIIRRKSIRPDIPVWWAYVQLGMGLPGLCIPVLHHRGAEAVLISSSQWEGYDYRWGTLPEIDDQVRCAGISVSHQAFDLTRQDKLNYIVAKCRDEALAPPRLTVCSRPYVLELNCQRCEKCLRTMTGIIVAGGDPPDFGFSIPAAEVWERVQGARDRHQLTMAKSELYLWQDIRKHAKAAIAGRRSTASEGFVGWLAEQDFETYSDEYTRRHRWKDQAKAWLDRNPALFEMTKRVIERRRWFGY